MSATELRDRLIEKIKNTDDENILEEAYGLLDLETIDLKKYELSDEQKTEVNEALLQIKNGQSLTNDEVNKDNHDWLSK